MLTDVSATSEPQAFGPTVWTGVHDPDVRGMGGVNPTAVEHHREHPLRLLAA